MDNAGDRKGFPMTIEGKLYETVQNNISRLARIESKLDDLLEERSKYQKAIRWAIALLVTPILLGYGSIVWNKLNGKSDLQQIIEQLKKIEQTQQTKASP